MKKDGRNNYTLERDGRELQQRSFTNVDILIIPLREMEGNYNGGENL